MSYYDSFLTLQDEPKTRIIDYLDEAVERYFDVSSNYFDDIGEETEIGSLKFKHIEARVMDAVELKVGQKSTDDFKCIIFKDIEHDSFVGQRFSFDNNVWICYSVNKIKQTTNNIYVARCNTTINSQDEYGNLHEEPCHIDGKVLGSEIYHQRNIDIIQGRTTVCVQRNQWTENIEINSRLVFDIMSYRVRSRDGYIRQETFNRDSQRFMCFVVEYDGNNEYDNETLQIANYKNYSYKIITDEHINQKIGQSGKLNATIMLNNRIVNYGVTWEAINSNIIDLDKNGNYTTKANGDVTAICTMKGNKDIKGSVTIHVSDNAVETYETRIEPQFDYVVINSETTFYINEYLNNNKIDTQYNITTEINNKYYSFNSNANSFTIKNIRGINKDITIQYENLRNNEIGSKIIRLRGLNNG